MPIIVDNLDVLFVFTLLCVILWNICENFYYYSNHLLFMEYTTNPSIPTKLDLWASMSKHFLKS